MTQPADTHITATPGHGHDDHGHAAPPPASPFTDQEWNSFHNDDRVAAASIVLLIGGIFTVGIFLYTIVDLVVSSAP